jgi:hypothetical protein
VREELGVIWSRLSCRLRVEYDQGLSGAVDLVVHPQAVDRSVIARPRDLGVVAVSHGGLLSPIVVAIACG